MARRTEHRRPCLVNDVEADGATPGARGMSKRDAVRVMNIREVDGQLVNVRVEDLVHESDTR